MEGGDLTKVKSHETVYLKNRMEEACVGIYAERKLINSPDSGRRRTDQAKSHETVYLKDRMLEACGNICRKEAHK